MSVKLSKKQLAPLAEGESNALTVHDSETDLNYVVIPESAYKKAQPLLDMINSSSDHSAQPGFSWSERDNLRRIVLINRKHDSGISESEEEELQKLQNRAFQFRNQVAPATNSGLTLLLEALESRAESNQ